MRVSRGHRKEELDKHDPDHRVQGRPQLHFNPLPWSKI
jgi:hypothetical protein